VRNVRDAWRQVAKDPDAVPAPPQVTAISSGRRQSASQSSDYEHEPAAASSWTA